MFIRQFFAVTLLMVTATVPGEALPEQTQEYRVKFLGTVQTALLREASGLAQSGFDEKIFWSHNDSGFGPFLFAFGIDGTNRARYRVEGVTSRDWEDIASFRWNSRAWLLVADTGDNSSRKKVSMLHLIEEPDVTQLGKTGIRTVAAHRTIQFVFPGGPADCESVAVDPVEQKIYLLTKRQRPPRLYSVPLNDELQSDNPVTATFEGEVTTIPSPTAREVLENPAFGIYMAQPTAMDFAPDGSFAVVNTYGSAYRYDRSPGTSWADAFNSPPMRIYLPAMKQSEAIAVVRPSGSIMVTSEGMHPPLYLLYTESPDQKEQ